MSGPEYSTIAAIRWPANTTSTSAISAVTTAVDSSARERNPAFDRNFRAGGLASSFSAPFAPVNMFRIVVAGAAMAFSSVSVVTNSLRLRSFGR